MIFIDIYITTQIFKFVLFSVLDGFFILMQVRFISIYHRRDPNSFSFDISKHLAHTNALIFKCVTLRKK